MKAWSIALFVGAASTTPACFYAAGLDQFEGDDGTSGKPTTTSGAGGSGGDTTSVTASSSTDAGPTTDASTATTGVGGGPCELDHLVITELRTAGPGGADDELVELYNATGKTVSIADWHLRFRNPNSDNFGKRWTGEPGAKIGPGKHYLIAGDGYRGTRDAHLGPIGDDQVAVLFKPDKANGDFGEIVDVVCTCSDQCDNPDWTGCPSEYGLANPSSSEQPTNKTIQRAPECNDTDTQDDFTVGVATPESM